MPAGRVTDEIVTTMDLLPSLAGLARAAPPKQPIDGHDVRWILFGESSARSPWNEKGFMYYQLEQLQAVRSGPWKLYLPLAAKYQAINRRTAPAKLELYNVRDDVGETREVSAEHPDVVQILTARADAARAELGDMENVGRGQRQAGHVEQPQALAR
jgi:arylsulfatase A-like enzyme